MKIGPRLFRFLFNFYPPYLTSRTVVKYIAPDWKKVVVQIKKSILTRNYVGTTFGGSLFQATDPFYMLMLVKILGIRDYIVWDQSAEIIFKRPARSTVTFTFEISDQELDKIRRDLQREPVIRPVFGVQGIDQAGEVCVEVKKTIYIRRKIAD